MKVHVVDLYLFHQVYFTMLGERKIMWGKQNVQNATRSSLTEPSFLIIGLNVEWVVCVIRFILSLIVAYLAIVILMIWNQKGNTITPVLGVGC